MRASCSASFWRAAFFSLWIWDFESPASARGSCQDGSSSRRKRPVESANHLARSNASLRMPVICAGVVGCRVAWFPLIRMRWSLSWITGGVIDLNEWSASRSLRLL